MPTGQHAQRPDDHLPCDCGGCQEFRAIHGGFCAELPLRERHAKRINDRAAQIRFNESTAAFGDRFGDTAPHSKAS